MLKLDKLTALEAYAKFIEEGFIVEQCKGEFVGYLGYGAEKIVSSSTEGFFTLYNAPTLQTYGEQYYFADLYSKYNVEPYGALQSFGGSGSCLNPYGNTDYENQILDPEKGTLVYNGMERYAIAIGPTLQDPEYDFGVIEGKKMAYGTCVDITIVLDDVTYYIPAVIVDVKEHSAPTGVFQTGRTFGSQYVDTGGTGPIVEWYVYKEDKEDKEGNNKSAGLNKFNQNGSIIIYREEMMD